MPSKASSQVPSKMPSKVSNNVPIKVPSNVSSNVSNKVPNVSRHVWSSATLPQLRALGFIMNAFDPYNKEQKHTNICRNLHPKAQVVPPSKPQVVPPFKAQVILLPKAQVVPPSKPQLVLPPKAQVVLPHITISLNPSNVHLVKPSKHTHKKRNTQTSEHLSKPSYKDKLLQNLDLSQVPPSKPLQVPVQITKMNNGQEQYVLLLPPPPSQRQARIENDNQELLIKLPKRNVDTIQKSDKGISLELVASLGNAMKTLDNDATGWDDAEKYQESVSGFWRKLEELRRKKVNNIAFSCVLCFVDALKRARARLHSQAQKQIKQKQMMVAIREMSSNKKYMKSFITAWRDHVAMLPELRRLRDKKRKLKTPTPSNYEFQRKEINELLKGKKTKEEVDKKKKNEQNEANAHTLRIHQLEARHRTKADNESKSKTGNGNMRPLPPGDSDSDSDSEPDEYDAAGNIIINTPSNAPPR